MMAETIVEQARDGSRLTTELPVLNRADTETLESSFFKTSSEPSDLQVPAVK